MYFSLIMIRKRFQYLGNFAPSLFSLKFSVQFSENLPLARDLFLFLIFMRAAAGKRFGICVQTSEQQQLSSHNNL